MKLDEFEKQLRDIEKKRTSRKHLGRMIPRPNSSKRSRSNVGRQALASCLPCGVNIRNGRWHDTSTKMQSISTMLAANSKDRLQKSYRPETPTISSWQCDRVLKVPGKFLQEPGAYVLAVEANGQTAYAPLLVDPLSLSLERCRDGVLAMGWTPTA